MFAITYLGSGSQGNSALLELGPHRFLFDAGFSCRRIETYLKTRGWSLDDLHGIILTHDHGDHIRGVAQLLKRRPLPVFASEGTLGALRKLGHNIPEPIGLKAGREVEWGGIRLWPFTVPHDAPDPLGLRFEFRGQSLAVATDLGQITPAVRTHLANADILCLESNYDEALLASCTYPDWLKRRIRGPFGHLPNSGAKEYLGGLERGPRHLVLVHVSQESNTPAQALQTVGPVMLRPGFRRTTLTIVGQDEPSATLLIPKAPMASTPQVTGKKARGVQGRLDFSSVDSEEIRLAV